MLLAARVVEAQPRPRGRVEVEDAAVEVVLVQVRVRVRACWPCGACCSVLAPLGTGALVVEGRVKAVRGIIRRRGVDGATHPASVGQSCW